MSEFQQKTEQVKETIKKEVGKIPPTTDRNLMAAISYIWILGLFILLMKRNDEFIAFHARQGIALSLLSLIWWFPVIGQILFFLCAAGIVLGFLNAWQGKEWKIPYIYQLSQWLKSKGL
jgi:uncharacterized membrane protein